MKESMNLGPVELSYVAAVRGLQPRTPGQPFTYVRLRSEQPEFLICLAASNPEGQFVFAFDHADEAATARALMDERDVKNVQMIEASCETFAAAVDQGKVKISHFDYICVDASTLALSDYERAALIQLAERNLTPQGLMAVRYQPQARQDDHLGYLLSQYGPELSPEQMDEFIGEMQALGGYCFSRSGALRAAFEVAKASRSLRPLETCLGRLASGSATVDMFKAMSGKKLMYVGDGSITDNFLELSTPPSAHDLLVQLQNTVLYEAIKDFATDRVTRTDLWCRTDAVTTESLVARFNDFTFGMADTTQAKSSSITRNGRTFDLTLPVFDKLIQMMLVMPISIGDFIEQHKHSGLSANDAVNAVQFLVALGVASPMRDSYAGYQQADYYYPRVANPFNRATMALPLRSGGMMVASAVVGRPLICSEREAVVLQAVTRSGITNSAGYLLPELERLSRDPSLSASVLGGKMPNDSLAQSMIREICTDRMTHWYALGILSA